MASKAERETIIRWDDEGPMATLYTASPAVARKWTKWGWTVKVTGTYEGEPTGWQGEAPKRAIRVAKRATFEKVRPQRPPRPLPAGFGRRRTTDTAGNEP